MIAMVFRSANYDLASIIVQLCSPKLNEKEQIWQNDQNAARSNEVSAS
jgi:hypothetical protein